MNNPILKKVIANALSARRKHILAIRSFKYKKSCREYQNLTDTAEFLEKLVIAFRTCESFSISFYHSNGDKVDV